MIHLIPTEAKRFRTFGWVQDPSDFRSLCDVVAIFDETSLKHQKLAGQVIPALVEERDGRQRLLDALNQRPLRISYTDLVGTSFTPRSAARCNGIVQAAVRGQVRPFIGDWPADNFVRWAHALGFLRYGYQGDVFELTETGRALAQARTQGEELNSQEKELLTSAVLAYPPAVRILSLLREGEGAHLTKFELGKQLGFVGEDGFTSLPQTVLVRSLASSKDAKEKNKMKTDWDGSSDKYARMIAKWLEKLGLVKQTAKSVTVTLAGRKYTESIGQSYVITGLGITALNRTLGKSRHKRIPKNVSFEMMATKGDDREYLRTRRTYVLKAVSEGKGRVSYTEIQKYLEALGLQEDEATIRDDVQGLIHIGLNIAAEERGCVWKDEINDLILPVPKKLAKSSQSETKEKLREKLRDLPHEYLSLVDLAYDSKQNRLFEMKVIELLTEECGFQGLHLGGSRRPDGVLYTAGLTDNYGIILDTKAYSSGYSLPIAQADEMERYVRENQTRDELVNPNKWWENFENGLGPFYFLFVAGHFNGNVQAQLERISRNTGVLGAAASISQLLLLADAIRGGRMDRERLRHLMFQNEEFLLNQEL